MFQPTRSLCTVVLDPKESKTKGGLHLPDTFADIMLTGTIRNLGPGQLTDEGTWVQEPNIRIGSKVMIASHRDPHTGKPLAVPTITDSDGVAVALCDTSEVLGVIENVQH